MWYTIFCNLAGTNAPFDVDIKATLTVSDLRDGIKVKKRNILASIEAEQLTLYRIDTGVETELNLEHELSVVFGQTGPPEAPIHVLVRLPEGQLKTPELGPAPFFHHTPTKSRQEVDQLIATFLTECRPQMRQLLENAKDTKLLLPLWNSPLPDEGITEHVKKLAIPTVSGGRPSLLLHNLGEELDRDYTTNIFSFIKHTVLINTSGSGKTRALLEGLCRQWGFYFAANPDMSGIGSSDFTQVMEELDTATHYESAKAVMRNGRNPEVIEAATNHIREVVGRRLAQLLLARFLLLDLLIQEAQDLPTGLQENEHRRLWVLLQVQPVIFGYGFSRDIFTDLTQILRDVSTHDLKTRIRDTHQKISKLLPHVRSPTTNESRPPLFFCVLDEVQVTVDPTAGRLGEFVSSDNETKRPILREIWLSWTTILQRWQMHLVLSGTGIDFLALRDTLSSTACKPQAYELVHNIGAFDSREAQARYIRRYLPARWDDSQWEGFLDRAWVWFRGRYRNTATLVALILEAGFLCPHRTINGYVQVYTGFEPTDGVRLATSEPKFPADFPLHTRVSVLTFDKMKPTHVEVLCDLIWNQILYGRYDLDDFAHADQAIFVEYGFARHKAGETVFDEPLAILAAVTWLDKSTTFSLFSRLYHGIHAHSPRKNGFEAYLAFYLRHVFETAPALDQIFSFREDFARRADLRWKGEQFELVTVVAPANTNDPRISVLTPSSGSSSNVGFTANSGKDVVQWITTNNDQYTFCFPPETFGPDLLFFIRSKVSQKLLLVIVQAKHHHEKVKKAVLTKGIRSVTPLWFWKSKKPEYATAGSAPFIGGSSVELANSTKNALKDIPHGLKVKDSSYPVLRVFASWPESAGLERSTGQDHDKHPLAALRLDTFNDVGQKFNVHWFRGTVEQMALKRARDDSDSESLPEAKRTKREL